MYVFQAVVSDMQYLVLFRSYTDFKVPKSAKNQGKICRFSPIKMYGIPIGPPSDLCYKITPHSDILAKVPWSGVLRPQRLEREKIITGVKHNGLPT